MLSSISDSAGSLSDSISYLSKSSTSSSPESEEAYLLDIRQYTAAYIRTRDADVKGLAKGLAAVSEKHGVTNWEASAVTFAAIGEGFANAALTQQQVDRNAALLASGNQLRADMIQLGFESGL